MWENISDSAETAGQKVKDSGEGPEVSTADWAAAKLGFDADDVQRQLLNSTSTRVILNCTRQWGKSTVTAAKAVHRACTEPESLTLVVSPSARQSAEFVRKAARFARKLKIKVKGDGDNELSVAFPNGSRLVGLPGMESTIRGFSAVSLLLIDEAARVDEEMYLAVRPMLAVSGGAMWMMSTPFGGRGFFYETWTHGGPEWEKVKVTATECPRIPASFLEEERLAMPTRNFRQEYMCEFEQAEGYVFDRALIERAIRWDIEPLKI